MLFLYLTWPSAKAAWYRTHGTIFSLHWHRSDMLYSLKQNYQKKHQFAANLKKLSLNSKALWEVVLIKTNLQAKKYYLSLKTQKHVMNTLNVKFVIIRSHPDLLEQKYCVKIFLYYILIFSKYLFVNISRINSPQAKHTLKNHVFLLHYLFSWVSTTHLKDQKSCSCYE